MFVFNIFEVLSIQKQRFTMEKADKEERQRLAGFSSPDSLSKRPTVRVAPCRSLELTSSSPWHTGEQMLVFQLTLYVAYCLVFVISKHIFTSSVRSRCSPTFFTFLSLNDISWKLAPMHSDISFLIFFLKLYNGVHITIYHSTNLEF